MRGFSGSSPNNGGRAEILDSEGGLYLHEEALIRFGGSSGIGDLGMVESALGAAQTHSGMAGATCLKSKKRLDKAGLVKVLRRLTESET